MAYKHYDKYCKKPLIELIKMGTLVINKIHHWTIHKQINSTTINELNEEVLRKQMFFSVNKEGFSESNVYGAIKYIRKQTLDCCLFSWHNGCQV